MGLEFILGVDYYLEKGQIIMTESYLAKRATCCGGGCRHCCYNPPFVKGTKTLQEKNNNSENN